jgi:hypothetical protein
VVELHCQVSYHIQSLVSESDNRIHPQARGLHNGFLASDPDNRQMGCNGCSLTRYAPNRTLVRDPRWGRAQEVD